MRIVAVTTSICLLLAISPQSAEAHWCSNIWQAPARLVVRPESSTINLASSGSTRFRVYMGNNFPYKLHNVRLRGTASGYTVNVTPSGIAMGPGQVIGFEFEVTPSGGGTGDVEVSSLGIEVAFEATGGNMPDSSHNKPYDPQLNRTCMFSQEFGGSPSDWIRTNTSDAAGVSLYEGGACWAYQSTGLAVAAVAEVAPNQPMPNGRNPLHQFTAMEQLIHMFGYRNCYSYDGRQWSCFSDQNCGPFGPQTNVCDPPEWSSGDNRFGQTCVRAGAQLATLHSRGLLGSYLGAARDGAINAMTGSGGCASDPDNGPCNDAYKCLGAVVGALLWRGAADSGPFTTALASGANGVPTACQDAANHILDGGRARTCSDYTQFYEQAACAAAAGLRGDQGPARDILLAQALHYNFSRLYFGYMLSIVAQNDRATGQTITYYPDAGTPLRTDALPPDTSPTQPDASPVADRGTITTEGGGVVVTDLGQSPAGDRGSQSTPATGKLSGGCALSSTPPRTQEIPALLLGLVALALCRRR